MSTPAVSNAIRLPEGRIAVMATRQKNEVFLNAQKVLVIEMIREFYAAYRKDYADEDCRKGNRRVLEKYFWLRRYHNAAVEKRRLPGFAF